MRETRSLLRQNKSERTEKVMKTLRSGTPQGLLLNPISILKCGWHGCLDGLELL